MPCSVLLRSLGNEEEKRHRALDKDGIKWDTHTLTPNLLTLHKYTRSNSLNICLTTYTPGELGNGGKDAEPYPLYQGGEDLLVVR